MTHECVVGIDCDGVIRNLMLGVHSAFQRVHPELMGHFHDRPDDPPEYEMEGMMCNYDPEVAGKLDRIAFGGGEVTRRAYVEAPMMDDARENYSRVYRRLKQAGATVVICSKQPTAAQQRFTARWLEDHGIRFDGLAFTTSSKGCFGLDWLFDDRYKHVLEVGRNGGQGVLRARRHNRIEWKRSKHVVERLEDFGDIVLDGIARNKDAGPM